MKTDSVLANQMEALALSIAKLTENEGYLTTEVPGLTVFKKTDAAKPIAGLYEPSVCLIAQGAKRVQLGDEKYTYDTQHYLFPAFICPLLHRLLTRVRKFHT